jgi:hypothetical protein
MPHHTQRNRPHDAVLWPAEGIDDYGAPKVGEPVELKVRWENRRTETTDAQGNVIALDATVVVDREIAAGSKMWKGTWDDWYGVGSAGSDVGLCEVVMSPEVPDIKGRNVRRVVGLRRFRDSLPESN